MAVINDDVENYCVAVIVSENFLFFNTKKYILSLYAEK